MAGRAGEGEGVRLATSRPNNLPHKTMYGFRIKNYAC